MFHRAVLPPSFLLPIFLLGFLVFSVCPATADPPPSFVVEVVYTGANPIFSLDCGELNSTHGGPEIAVLTNDGHVRIITPGAIPWPDVVVVADTDTAWSVFSRPTIAVGDLDPSVAGDEIASMSNKHLNVGTCVWEDSWSWLLLYDFSPFVGSVWGARVGDYMPSHPGDEVFLIYEGVLDCSDGTVFYFSNGMWWDDVVYEGQVGMDSAVGEFDSFTFGPDVIITTEMGPTHVIWEGSGPPDDLWPGYVLWDDMDNAGWVCEVADVDEIYPGSEIVFGTRYNNSILVSYHWDFGGPAMELIFTGQDNEDPRNMVDIATGNIIPESEGLEIVGVDDSGRLYLIRREQGSWIGENIWTDTGGGLYAVVVEDFLPEYPGQEIVVAGETGNLTLIRRQDPSPVPQTSDLMGTLLATLNNFPNPFNPETVIRFDLTETATVGLTVHSIDGKLIRRFNVGQLNPGSHSYSWRGNDDSGKPVASGVYFYRLTVEGQSIVRQMVLVK
jgi:hypothetical protein